MPVLLVHVYLLPEIFEIQTSHRQHLLQDQHFEQRKNQFPEDLLEIAPDLGDNQIQNFHLGRYIIGYTVGNLALRRRVSGAVKRDFRTYIRRYTSPNENFEYGYPHSNALLKFPFKRTVKMYFVAPIRPAAASCIKPLASCIYSLVSQ